MELSWALADMYKGVSISYERPLGRISELVQKGLGLKSPSLCDPCWVPFKSNNVFESGP